ncbi:MAG: hypothetical protein GWP06_06475 [Actinobacteria bacterium]|nr:hypothetical protein [Actinomycetota bacterium]
MKTAMKFIIHLIIIFLLLTSCAEKDKIDLSKLKKATRAELTTVYSPGDTTYRDIRLEKIRKGRDMSYAMPEYKSLHDWETRAAKLKKHIFIANGLWPMPEKTPLHARVYDKIEHKDYSVEKVYFESYPGFYVTGNLYRPVGKTGPFPGIISPHGHWQNGRLENSEKASVPGRCINFARQGYVIFSYDMVGYEDSKQVSHHFADTKMHQLWGISLMGLQLWDSIRALDFITSLADVDTSRIGCTGASGGGTQTFMVTAVDDRIKVAAPVNMISAHFQGGCLCENVPELRLNTFNVEIGALTAPRPLLMVSDTHDWTKNTPTVEYPMMRKIYDLYNADEKLKYVQYDFPHNYNKTSRDAVYAWFAKWLLHDDDAEKYKEKTFTVEAPENLLNFSDKNPPPGEMNEEKLTEYLKGLYNNQLVAYWPKDNDQLKKIREVYGTALQDILDVEIPENVETHIVGQSTAGGFAVTQLLISRAGQKDWIPAIFYQPVRANGRAVLIVHPQGKAALAKEGSTQPIDLVAALLKKGCSVLAIDAFKTGEHTLPASMKMRDESISHYTTFNKTDLQERIQDIATAVGFLNKKLKVSLIGLEKAGPWALLAAAVIPHLSAVVADGAHLDIQNEHVLLQDFFTPGLAKVGGMLTAAALVSPTRLYYFNAPENISSDKIKAVYKLAGKPGNVLISRENFSEKKLEKILF